MRLVVCDNGLVRRSGHNYHLAYNLHEEARRRELELVLFGNAAMAPDVARELEARPLFRHSPYELRSRRGHLLHDFASLSRAFAEDTSNAETRGGDVLLVPSATAAEAAGLSRWLGNATAPPAAVWLHVVGDESWMTDATNGLPRLLFRAAAGRLALRLPAGRLFLSTGSSALSVELASLSGTPVHTLPMPKAYPDLPDRTTPNPVPVVVCLGSPRREKGAHLLGDVARLVAESGAPFRLLVQISLDRPERSYARLAEQLTAAANLTTVPGPFTRTEYYGLLAGSDVVLLPYRAERYRVRTSGVFAEALALGKVVVAPSGSWMEERLAEGYGAGVLFEEFEPESMASALVDALSRLDALSAKARERAPRWRADQCLEAFFDRLLDELAASGALHA